MLDGDNGEIILEHRIVGVVLTNLKFADLRVQILWLEVWAIKAKDESLLALIETDCLNLVKLAFFDLIATNLRGCEGGDCRELDAQIQNEKRVVYECGQTSTNGLVGP